MLQNLIAAQIPERILSEYDRRIHVASTVDSVFAALGLRDTRCDLSAVHLPDQRASGALAIQRRRIIENRAHSSATHAGSDSY